MSSILFVVWITYYNQFKRNYLRNKGFFQCFAAFLKFRSGFQHFEKKDEIYSLFISEIKDCNRRD